MKNSKVALCRAVWILKVGVQTVRMWNEKHRALQFIQKYKYVYWGYSRVHAKCASGGTHVIIQSNCWIVVDIVCAHTVKCSGCKWIAYFCLHKHNYKVSRWLHAACARLAITSTQSNKDSQRNKIQSASSHTFWHSGMHASARRSRRSGCHCDWFLLPRANPQ